MATDGTCEVVIEAEHRALDDQYSEAIWTRRRLDSWALRRAYLGNQGSSKRVGNTSIHADHVELDSRRCQSLRLNFQALGSMSYSKVSSRLAVGPDGLHGDSTRRDSTHGFKLAEVPRMVFTGIDSRVFFACHLYIRKGVLRISRMMPYEMEHL